MSTPRNTLAAADALDLLLRPGLPVLAPDGVHWKTLRHADKPGPSPEDAFTPRTDEARSL